MIRKKLVVLTGAGISAESGIRTFRDMGGLWEEYDVMEVASYDGWVQDPKLVLKFYNDRRKQLKDAKPNQGHISLAEAEKFFDIHIITQNVDNLHERAGSAKILHLHGELTKVESTADSSLIHDIGYTDLNIGDKCEKGSQLRPHIVWFGEPVPAMMQAIQITRQAEIFAVVGTSLNVYPAAGLVGYVSLNTPIYLIDPNEVTIQSRHKVHYIKENASVGVTKMMKMIQEST
ncbi:MAG: NAD-dependent deacetylase [Tenuifilaceae bacterium]